MSSSSRTPAEPRIPTQKRARAVAHRDLTEGSIPKNLWFLTWPTMVTGVLQIADNAAELIWAGFLGFRAIASIGVAQTWIQLFNSGRMGLDTATRAMVSRAVGARDLPLANHVATQSLLFNAAAALAMMLVGVFFTEPLLRLLGVSEEVIAEGGLYLQMRFVAQVSFSLFGCSSSILQATGDPITPMKAQAAARLLQIVLAPLLVFGWLGLPTLDLPGIAVAVFLAQTVGLAITIHVLLTGRSRLRLSIAPLRPDFPLLWRMVRLGTPASVTNSERSLAQLILVGIVTPFGDTTLAAYSLTQRLQMFVNFGQHGVGQAAGVLSGQNLGAREVARARATVWWALGYTLLFSLFVGGAMLLFPTAFLIVFTREEHLLETAAPWLRITVLGFIAMGASTVFMQVFNTAGDTLVPMLVSLGSIWAIQQPAAILLSGAAQRAQLLGWQLSLPVVSGLGDLGIAWAIVLAMAVRVAVYLPYFLWGPWWRKKV